MLQITFDDLSKASKSELKKHKYDLITDQMKLNKFFSTFLAETPLNDRNTETPEWLTYRMMIENYDRIDQLIRATYFWLK